MIYRMSLPDGVYEYVSPSSINIFGYRSEEFYQNPMLIADVIHPDWKDYFLEQWQNLLEGTMPPFYEYQIINKSGQERWLYQRNVLVKDDEGQPIAIEGIVTDITERKQAEKALQESRQRLLLILDHFPARVFWKDKNLDFLGCNQLHAEDRGLNSPDEIVGKNDYDFFPVEEAELYRADDRTVIISGKAKLNFEEPQTRFDGSTRWLRTSKVPLYDGDDHVIGILGTYEDITERKQAEEEIRRQNRELTLLNQVIAASSTGLAAEPVLETVCREMALAFDVPQSLATLINQEEEIVTIVAEYKSEDQRSILNEKIPLADNTLAQYFMKEKTPLVSNDAVNDPRLTSIAHLLRKRNVVSILSLPLFKDNEVMGTLSLTTNKTRKFSPNEIELGQRVAKQVAGTLARIQLDEKNRQLEEQYRQGQKMEAIGRLAGGMAHDFNNLLTVITGYSELLLHRHMDKNSHEFRNVEQIRRAGERAARLTRQLLAFSRQQVIKPEILDLNEVITDMNKMLRRLVTENIELITDLAPTLGQIKADRGQIEQIIMNLTVNASDAMPQGGQLTTRTATIDLSEEEAGLSPGAYVLLSISDTGVGMDAETQAHIFEPFFTTKEVGKGTGLGLATVYGIVRQNRGNITVSSRPGEGTTFEIYLPCYHEEETSLLTRQGQATPEFPKGKETILLVEDEDMVRDLARHTLQQNGYQILEARDGREALDFCREYRQPIHLLLTDVIMPRGLSGPDLAIQVMTLRPDIKVLYVSGYVDNEIVKHGVLNADVEFLQKPFSPTALARKVRDILDKVDHTHRE
jgi:PAS domain S-box-containing protein